MEIKWLGQSTFVIKSSTTLVTDPFNPMLGKLPADLTANVVTVSHNHKDHSYTQGVGGSPQIVNTEGDFRVGDFEIRSVATFHDKEEGHKRGQNIVYVIRAENITLCHLGDLGHILTTAQTAEIGKIDILMIPVGGFFTIDAVEAIQVFDQLKPKLILPMHYNSGRSFIPLPIAKVDKFTQALKWEVENVKELQIDRPTIDSMSERVVIFKK